MGRHLILGAGLLGAGPAQITGHHVLPRLLPPMQQTNLE